ncbi:MAG: hypothetical protein PHD82_07870 [Candidatus Riflebacteria bacterium]|jgi:tRNA A37 threonylcarbamoyladenosine modification protein TsaB|nr:hypothetical protein [Candidatus Riflebacteria bacterium]
MKYLFIDASENSTYTQVGNEKEFKQKTFATDRNFAAKITCICDEILQTAGLAFKDLDLLAVCTGPGSLTGLRVAGAFLRTSAMLTGKPLAGINLFEWSLQTLANQGKTGPVRLVMPTLIDKAFEVRAELPSVAHSQPELIERSETGKEADTYGIRFNSAGIIELTPDPIALHQLIISGKPATANGLQEILNILPMYVIPSQAERKFKEAT